MAWNTCTISASLANEVADLLGHDNIDRRILEWLTLTYNDMVVRIPCNLFYETADAVSFSAASSADLGAAVEARFGSPVLCVFKVADGTIYTPRYTTPQDFDRIEKEQQGTALDSGSIPLVWTVGPTVTLTGRRALRVYPQVTATAWLWYTGVNEDDELTGTEYFRLPYHWEHVLIWGTAAFGARMLRPSLAPLFSAEYEEGINKLALMVNSRPDAVPVLQSIVGPYEGTPILPQAARFPNTIG